MLEYNRTERNEGSAPTQLIKELLHFRVYKYTSELRKSCLVILQGTTQQRRLIVFNPRNNYSSHRYTKSFLVTKENIYEDPPAIVHRPHHKYIYMTKCCKLVTDQINVVLLLKAMLLVDPNNLESFKMT